MDAKDFVENAKRTEPDYEKAKIRVATRRSVRLLHGLLGKLTELGEFADPIKKYLFYGKELDEVNLLEEIGDGNWYDAIILDELKSSFPEVWDKIINKLRIRFGDKFTEEKAINRNLEAERKSLEK